MSTTDAQPIESEEAAETFRERIAFYAYASVAWLGRTLAHPYGSGAVPAVRHARVPPCLANSAPSSRRTRRR